LGREIRRKLHFSSDKGISHPLNKSSYYSSFCADVYTRVNLKYSLVLPSILATVLTLIFIDEIEEIKAVPIPLIGSH
jgi:hypothetical protein